MESKALALGALLHKSERFFFAGRGLQPRPKRLMLLFLLTFET